MTDIGHSEDTERIIILPEIIITPEPHDKLIVRILTSYGVSDEMATIIVAQAKHETGNFTSDICWENYNYFGMKQAKKRKTTAIGTNRGHAVYTDFENCVIDYFYYLEGFGYHLDQKVVKTYVIELKNKRYFEASLEGYYRAVKRFYES